MSNALAMSNSLWLSNASPMFFYSPDSVYFGGTNMTGSWRGIIQDGVAGPNNTLRMTAGMGGVILPSIYASTFTPLWTDSGSFATQLQIGRTDPVPWVSGSAMVFDFEIQTYTLYFTCTRPGDGCDGQEVGFRGAWIETEYGPPGSTLDQVVLDDASPAITYFGFQPLSSTSPSDPNAGGAVSIDISSDYSGTLSTTGTSGASATVSFRGASILVKGATGPTTGPYTATLDGTLVATFNGQNDVISHDVVLFFDTNLDTSLPHTLVLAAIDPVNGGEGSSVDGGGVVGLVIDSFTVYGPQGDTGFIGVQGGVTATFGPTANGGVSPTQTTAPTGGSSIEQDATSGGSPSAGVIIGALLGTLAGIFLLMWFFRRHLPRIKPKSKDMSPADRVNNLQVQQNEEVWVTSVAKDQNYVYPGQIASSDWKRH